jgi:TolB-like protein
VRQALGEDAQHPRVLHTVHGIGYRFDLPPATAFAPVAPAPIRNRGYYPAAIVFVVGVPLVLAAFAAVAWLGRGEVAAATSGNETAVTRPSLAVLPFADLSESHDQEYLADGLAEEIINQLAQLPALRVVGRTSSFSFKGRNEDLRAIGEKLGVTHLLEGSVRRAGDQLRITAQLIRADDGSHLWSKTYARELRDVFAVQEEISRDVALALSVKLDVVTFNREQGGTTSVEAYDRYLRWRSIVMRELFDFEHDRERLQLAREMVALDLHCVLCREALASSLNSVAQEVGGAQVERFQAESAEVRK